jgi:ATP-binding cassette subfamily B protein RaxB
MNASLVARRHELVLAVGQRLIFGLERVAVVWLGALAVMDQQISTGMLFAFLAYQEQFATRFGALIDKAGELQLLRLQGERLADIVRTPPEEDAGAPLPAGTELAGRLTVRGLHFRYADVEAEVLQDISFSVAPGESVAITGPSGGGKTTLLKLLLGIYGPQAGEICIDGLPLARLGRARWRNLIGTVMQDEPLFAGSIADNIAFFAPDPDRDWIEACARRPRCTRRSWPCPWVTPPWWATWAPACRAGRSSASCWPGRCTSARASCCWTRPPARWTWTASAG